MRMHVLPFALCVCLAATLPPHSASAQGPDSGTAAPPLSLQLLRDSVARASQADANFRLSPFLSAAVPQASSKPPAAIVEYSDAYRTRARIHRIASYATVPLFATELFLGESLYDNPSEGKSSAHLAVAGGIAGLFAVESVTGVWNMIEARHDPNGRGRRWVHGILMLIAGAGFVATAALAPGESDEGEGREVEEEGGGGSRSTHRAVALGSIGVATVGYLVKVIGR